MPMLQLLLVHTGTSTQLWIILEYHLRGSLYSYLICNKITLEKMANFIISLSSAIEYLHFESVKKPGIIHRDIKSQNILVKQRGCIDSHDLIHVKSTPCISYRMCWCTVDNMYTMPCMLILS